jgi:hypothetical protein
MEYQDRIYGKIEITEPVILDLINCPTMQRLKGIDQAGYFAVYYPNTAHSRFEHSVGVYLLLNKYKASLEEQIAGLIHDVSHSAFSHCIDYVVDAGSQKEHNYQDNIFEDFVKKSEMPEIIKKHNLDLDYILDDKNFPLKEKNIPDLCADRIDYSLRAALVFNEIDNVEYLLDNLTAENNQWVFKNFESARKFTEVFKKLNSYYYAGLLSAAMFKTVGDCLKYSLEKGYFSEADLYGTDREVLEKIEINSAKDEKLKLLFDRMNNKIGFRNDPEDYESDIFCKSRIVDPLCHHNGGVKRVSQIDSQWKKILKEELKPKEYFIKYVR